jgi:gliding motility-associated-like protein
MASGAFYLRNGGFSVLQNDTADLVRLGKLIHGESIRSRGSSSAENTKAVTSTDRKGVPGRGTGSGPDGQSGGSNSPADYILHSHLYHVNFVNANPYPEVVPEKMLPNYNNYIVGKDPSKWASNVKIFLGVTFKNIYPGIDIHYYTNDGVLKYDLIVHPGADPSQIVLQYVGQDSLSMQKNQLSVKTSVSTVRELEPRSYQVDDKGRTMLPCNYVLNGSKVRFHIRNRSANTLLVIDPSEIFCTFTGSRSDNWGYTSTYDNAGNFYAGGIVLDDIVGLSPSLFGATAGAFQRTWQGGDQSEGRLNTDIGIMKFNSTGKAVVYATYLGGGGDEQPHSMICDAQGNLIVTGRTSSTDFPTVPAANSQYAGGGFDLYVTKLNATGSAVIGSVKIGGSADDGVNFAPKYRNPDGGDGTQQLRLNYGDDSRSEVILDASNNIFVASCTQSSDFPVKGAFQAASGGVQDGVVLKFDPNIATLMAGSYLGGTGADALFSLAISPVTNILYATGGTMSSNIPGAGGASAGAIGGAIHGGVDGLIAMIRDNGNSLSLITSRYFGTSTTDMIYGVQVDAKGFPYITGTTYGVIPVVNSPFNQGAGSSQSSGKQFITKLQPDLSAIVYSANFGPSGLTFPNISPTAFLVDRCENVYVSGWGGGVDAVQQEGYKNSTTIGLSVTPGAIKSTTDGQDFYFFVLQKNAASQLYGSFFGQNGGNFGDHVDGGTSRFDKQGIIYQSVCANCYGPDIFPVTGGVVFTRNGTGPNGCNEAAVKIAFNFAGVVAGLKVDLQGRGDSLGCAPLDVTLTDTIRKAKSYIWHYGDGTPDLATTDYSVQHTYTNVGFYRVMLIAIDSNSCNVADTVYHNIAVNNNRAIVDFNYKLSGPCGSFNYIFTNLSQPQAPALPFSDTAFTWILDQTIIPRQSVTKQEQHQFPSAGTYNVSLVLVDTNYCNAPDTVTRQLFISTNVVAIISVPDTGCAPGNIHFTNDSKGGQTYFWDFGDGTTSTDRTPADHYYANPGQYTVKLHVTDSATCNINSDTSVLITLLSKPSADFTTTPVPPTANTSTSFYPTNSPDVRRWEWIFGDGRSEVKFTGDTAMHQYVKTDTFQACLVVFNSAGCSDTVCHPVATLINPLLDVPNAFTPGRFGQNSIIKVMGFGIVRMNFRIFNRWGQEVFQSINPEQGWDGTYRGTLQPMDVYAYTLEAEFSDGTHVTRKGDITLVR